MLSNFIIIIVYIIISVWKILSANIVLSQIYHMVLYVVNIIQYQQFWFKRRHCRNIWADLYSISIEFYYFSVLLSFKLVKVHC